MTRFYPLTAIVGIGIVLVIRVVGTVVRGPRAFYRPKSTKSDQDLGPRAWMDQDLGPRAWINQNAEPRAWMDQNAEPRAWMDQKRPNLDRYLSPRAFYQSNDTGDDYVDSDGNVIVAPTV
jgi:hypothetical protein